MFKRTFLIMMIFVALLMLGLSGCGAPEEAPAPPVSPDTEPPEEAVAPPAEEYPRSPIFLIVPGGAGGGTDVLARVVAANAGEHFQQPLVVRNVPGGEFTIGITEALQSEPDGYTLALTPSDPLVFAPHTVAPEYDLEDIYFFDTVSMGAAALTINPDLGFESVDELLAYARDNPNELRIAQSNLRFEMCIELLRDAGYEFVNVPFPGGAETTAAIAGGHVDISLTSVAAVQGLHDAGMAKILMTTVPDLVNIDGVPTIEDYPEMNEILGAIIDTPLGIIGPKGIPEERLQFIHEALRKTFEEDGFIAMANRLGLPAFHVGADAFEQQTRAEYEIAKRIIEQTR